jgi:hypothetical protein
VKWLEGQLGDDPVRRQTFRLMFLHHVEGYSLEELAKEHRTNPHAIAQRIYKLSKELGPKVALMDRERPRRAILFFLWLFGAAVAAVVVLLIVALVRRADRPAIVPEVYDAAPAPSASANADAGPLIARAEELRREARASCAAEDWLACEGALIRAAELDPAGDNAPDVQQLHAVARPKVQEILDGAAPRDDKLKPGKPN